MARSDHILFPLVCREGTVLPHLCSYPLTSFAILAQALQTFAKRPALKRFAAATTHGFYVAWLEELATVKQEFEAARKPPAATLLFPATVAQAHRILQLRRRLQGLLNEHKVGPYTPPPSPTRPKWNIVAFQC